jgi:alpha-D-ribose 1-methylphosphonate 5-triphosphate synthase subunit PhnI
VIGLDGMDNDRTNTTHSDTSSMQVHQRLTTIYTFAPGGNILIVNFFFILKNLYHSSNLRFQENRFLN